MERPQHIPVLLEESLDYLNVRPGGVVCDATLGLGGHSAAIARKLGGAGKLICFDRDPEAMACVGAERTLVHALGASCHTPVGAHARRRDDGVVQLVAWAGLPDGAEWLRDEVSGSADEVGMRCAERMLAAGARELLDRAERQVLA